MFRVLHFLLPSSLLLLCYLFSSSKTLYLLGLLDRGNSPFHNASTFSLSGPSFERLITQVRATQPKVSILHLLIRSFKGSSSQIGNYFRSSSIFLFKMSPLTLSSSNRNPFLFHFLSSLRVRLTLSTSSSRHSTKLVLFFSVRLSLWRFSIIVRLPL